ncbi:CHAT domain-containing protein [Actinoplanes flavus]|uniref:CHAT domain-containing protein n=1 Tax=Actinoplanes flavus TaxID=2820290 RepID=A0ABS3UX76_9ACTN|nr:CHAT domain-containing protein [Actinoplanes flavus]MBO3743167.1 CHAT domain-containing protein [Actinoplanes flavus]
MRVTAPGREDLVRTMPAHPDETGRWWPAATEDELDLLLRLTDSLTGDTPSLATTRAYGRFLLLALLGPEGWELLFGGDDQPAELDLRFPPDDADLHLLTWELLHAPQDDGEFLAHDPEHPVMVVRGIAARAGGDREVRPVTGTARMLFAVGSELHDPQVRAGTEVMTIIRGYDRTCSLIDFRIRAQVTLDGLESACGEVRPHILHLIAHGSWHPDLAENTVQLRPEPGSANGEIDAHVNARALAGAMRAAGELPLMVILSACESGSSRPGGAAIAAELVDAGVPIVVSMTGRISNTACRTFARAFAAAVVRGKPLPQATAEARQLTFSRLRGGEIDWALPAVFMAGDVPDGFQVVDDRETRPLRDFLGRLGPVCAPVFHARDEFFDLLDHLLDPGDQLAVLIAEGPSAAARPGGTRLLRELAGASLRAGHLPCNVTFGPGGEPRNAAQLAVDVLWAIGTTRSELNLDVDFPSAILTGIENQLGRKLVEDTVPDRPLCPAVRAKWLRPVITGDCPEAFVDELAGWIREDLLRMATAAQKAYPALFPASGRPILLLDDPRQVPDLFVQLGTLLSTRGVSADTIGPESRDKIPVVVFTKDPRTRSDGRESRLTRALQDQAWARTASVMLFKQMTPDGHPDFVAAVWRSLIMHPLPTIEGRFTRPLTVVAERESDWAHLVRELTNGSEEIYSAKLMAEITRDGVRQKVLEEDNDDAALDNLHGSGSRV